MKTIIKRLTSYLKKDWGIEDYPIELYPNENAGEDKVKFGARILNWPIMVGHGETKELAFEKLKENFKLYTDNNRLPRPGTRIPITFAPTENIDKYEHIAVDFFRKVLDMDFYEGFQSDGSYIELLFIEYSNKDLETIKTKIVAKALEVYGVDITDVYHEELWKIFEKIKRET